MTTLNPNINYKVGDIYEFTVNSIHYNFCELVDGDGFYVYLKHTQGLNLSKGQKVRCKVTANYQKRPKIELVDDGKLEQRQSKVTSETVSKLINTPERQWNIKDFVSLLLMTEIEDRTFDNECRRWIEKLRQSHTNLEEVQNDCGMFLEESDFLSLCNPSERELYEQRLTQIIDTLGYYIIADKNLSDGIAPQFLEHLLDKLERTGYLYQPDKNFKIMSILLLSDSGLMEDNIPRLFDIIRKWPEEIWEKEPFKGALIRSLQLYVDENIWKVEKSSDNGKLVRNLIQALSILYIIAGNKDNHDTQMPDERLLLSRLCVLSTYIDEFSNKELLSMAVGNLLNDNYYRPKFTLDQTRDRAIPFEFKRRAASIKQWPINTTTLYAGNKIRLVINKDGMAVWYDSPKAKTVLPMQLNLWGNMHVYANRSGIPSLSGNITVSDSRRLWEAIEHEFFTPDATAVKLPKTETKHLKEVYGVGDTVYIAVTRVENDTDDDKSDNKIWCVIEGDKKESGYLYAQDIVSYMHHVSLWMFRDKYDKPLTFEATITDEDEDGQFHFSMLEGIKGYVCSQFSYGDDVICSMGTARRASTSSYPSPAITQDGYSVSLNGSIGEDLQRGDIVLASYQGKANGTFHIYCTLKVRFDGHDVDITRAFHNLMENYSVDDDADGQNTVEGQSTQITSADIETTDRMLDAAYVREIIRIIDRMAIIDADYVLSYNYISFARLLCRMIGWTEQSEYYNGRLQLIDMLYDFAINDKVNTSQLDRLQNEDGELFANDTPMHEKFQQLRIISFMGGQPYDDELMKFRSSTQGLTRQIASLAIAYNILTENNMKPQANDVLNHVKNMLRLNGYESHLKTYGGGIESKTVEFKTSIVYPPANDNIANIDKQMHTILSVIAAFLNTDGGTLYIGVNDSGAGVGVYDDLCYKEFNGDKDKYQRYILDAVALQWSNAIASYVSADWDHDDESGKDVLIVSVEPYAKGVEFGGEWLYRNGSGNRHLTKTEFEEYNALRQSRLAQRQTTMASQTEDNAVSDSGKEEVLSSSEQPKPTNPPKVIEKIKTSIRRRNVLEDYADDFVPYEACLKFLPHGKFEKLSTYDYDENTELTLPVYEEDVKDGYLMLGYEDGTIGKVPVKEIMRFDDYKEYNRYTGSKLIFASIATDTDGIITVSEEDKTGHRVMVRVDSIGNIEKGRLPESGNRVFNEGIASRIIQYEIAPSPGLGVVRNIFNRDPRTLGFPLKTISKDIRESLRQWGV